MGGRRLPARVREDREPPGAGRTLGRDNLVGAVRCRAPGSKASLLYDVTCETPSACWAVGTQGNGTSQGTIGLVERWNGTAWSVAPTPALSGYLFSVSCVGSGDCWAVGSSLDPVSGGSLHSDALHWDGSSWSVATIPSSGQSYDQVTGVTCVTGTDCWAVGAAGPNSMNGALVPNAFTQTEGSDTWILHWNGASWSGAPTADRSNPTGALLSGVTCVSLLGVLGGGGHHGSAGQSAQTARRAVERQLVVNDPGTCSWRQLVAFQRHVLVRRANAGR